MTEQQIAIAVLSLAYIFIWPLVMMAVLDAGRGVEPFWKTYGAFFIGWHLLTLIVAAITAVVFGIWWAIGVLV